MPPAAASCIRVATLADVGAIVAVTNRAFVCEQFCVSGDRTGAADIRQRFASGAFYVIDDPADCSRLHASMFCSMGHSRGYLGLLSVLPEAQGRGHSSVLLAEVEQHCREAGCNFLDITLVNVREEQSPFYARRGFAAVDDLSYDLYIWDPARHAPLPTNDGEAYDTK
jgi:GNAT superfamily N-acetyltransferase